MTNLLAKLVAFLPKIEAGATEAIELATEVRNAAQTAGVWTNEHESLFQSSAAAPGLPAPPVPVGTEPKPDASAGASPSKVASLIAFLCILASLLFTPSARAQINASNIVNQVTTNATQATALDNAITALGFGITNYTVDPYVTYAPNAPTKIGGGILGIYNFNQNAGAGIGLDWLGQFSLVSGNLTLKAPFHVATVFPSLTSASWYQNLVVTPFVLGGVGTPYSGNGHFNGSPMVISDVGGAVQFGHFLGGRFDAGGAWGKWIGSGPYGNITRYHFFVGFTHGF